MPITIIDDDESILELFSEYLDILGYPDISAISDANLLKDPAVLTQLVGSSDAILCDISMPELDGKEIMERVIEIRKKINKYPPFIFVSGIPKDYFPC